MGGLADPQRRGCLIANTVMELSPHETGDRRAQLRQALKMAEDTFFKVLTRAKQQGELNEGQRPARAGALSHDDDARHHCDDQSRSVG